MNKFLRSNFLRRSGLLTKKRSFPVRKYSESDKDKDKDIRDKQVTREKGGLAKHENIQEESYFHKEEIEQLKEIKKKLKEKKPEIDENKQKT